MAPKTTSGLGSVHVTDVSSEGRPGHRRLVTGDRPTGPLHLGHYVGTLRNRVLLQEAHETFILVADQHVLTTRLDRLGEIEANIRDDVLGNLAVGVDPEKATIYLQSQVPETAELFLLLGMLVSVPRAQRIPTLKDTLRRMHVTRPSYGLLGYPILQAADILLLKADVVPVGADQQAHVELTRELAREVNRHWRPVFLMPEGLIPDTGVLPGTDGGSKMSRSIGNTIDLFDGPEAVASKVMGMYTDPGRIHPTDPGRVKGNPVFALHEAFNADPAEVAELKVRYSSGRVGDVEVKRRLIAALEEFLGPIRERRRELLARQPRVVEDVLGAGALRARKIAAATLREVRAAMELDYFASLAPLRPGPRGRSRLPRHSAAPVRLRASQRVGSRITADNSW